MDGKGRIGSAHSHHQDARLAVRELHSALGRKEASLVLFFCSSTYDLDALADEMNRLFGATPVVGCTTAGEIGPDGYRDQSLTGVSFPAGLFTAVTGLLEGLQRFETAHGQAFAEDLLYRLDGKEVDTSARPFALLLIDGLSVREEPVVRALQTALRSVPLLGGSAGDNLRFERTWVFCNGAFHTDSAVLVLVSTALPFRIFKTQHFVRDEERLVVTEADPARRVVKEINGLPAAEEYARVAGVPAGDLDPMRFAATPVVVVINGTDYVRSIQKVNPDGSLTFYCAIEEGVVLRVARGEDMLTNLDAAFAAIRAEIGAPQLILGCDCILRKVELMNTGLKDKAAELFARNNTVGFSTYGEQYGGVHVNQTFTGIAIGGGKEPSDA